jgi:hypothetical protein
MWLYTRLCSVFSPFAARVLVGLWYGLLIVLVLFSVLEPQAEFRYGNI